MIQTFIKYIDRHKLLTSNDTVITGVSGGADSAALLHLLTRAGYTCIVAHCNFHLRGDESDRDEAFTKQMAASLHLPFFKTDFDTPQYANREKISIEMAARELRYRWFEHLRIEEGAQAIAVAHHRDDSIETALLNLTRGTGIRGLTGIHPRNGHVIRPLLPFDRNGIVAWLAENHIEYRTDSTNLSDEYARNFLRLHILPLLEKLNPSVRDAIARTAAHLADVDILYTDLIARERARIAPEKEKISIRELMQSPAPQTVLYELIKPYGFTRPLASSLFESLDGEPGKIFYAPESPYRIVKDRDDLLIVPPAEKDTATYHIHANESILQPVRLCTQQKNVDASFRMEKKKTVACFDSDKLAFPLTLRKWKAGDWFIPFGMQGRKKLSDYFTDHKFSRIQKEQTWLLCNGEDIIWIVGERIDERYRIDKTTKNTLIAIFLSDKC
ncbi:MAG: tRNA lysidine(34) synthetase TilS [Tannerella sp.]|jgi:tRNA(Ile)-lysidine synthase|nr:tRNA lysidine(34) synthetase TilS [Tannerella sp.]